MGWLTVDEVLKRVGKRKLGALTLEAGEKIFVGSGDDLTADFDLPFSDGTTVKVYAAGALVDAADYTLLVRGGTDTRDRLTFDAAPELDVRIEASAATGIGIDALLSALRQGQDTITMKLQAAGWQPPAADATSVPERLLSWNLDLSSYYLVSQLRRAPLADAYPDVKARYDQVLKDLQEVVDGAADIGTWLTRIVEPTGSVGQGMFVGEARAFDGRAGFA